MAQFTFSQYDSVVSKAQNGSNSTNQVKVGFFKLDPDCEALVRFNVKSVDDLHFATVHKPIFGKKFEGLTNPYAGISCFNELGSYSDSCPLCKAVSAEHQVIGKAEKKVYVPMLVSYKDKTTGAWSESVPVCWERPASYARELATKLQNYGDLTQVLLKMTRVGSGKETKYILDYAVPTIFKPEMVPVEGLFAFNNFKPNKHSYWELTKEEIEEYLATGEFKIASSATVETPTQATTTIEEAVKDVQPTETPKKQTYTNFSF